MENIESSWNILMVINFEILQYIGRKFVNKTICSEDFKINHHHLYLSTYSTRLIALNWKEVF